MGRGQSEHHGHDQTGAEMGRGGKDGKAATR
jgi:hypothetical protein